MGGKAHEQIPFIYGGGLFRLPRDEESLSLKAP